MLIILCMCPANERRRYNVTSSLINWAHSQNDPCMLIIGCLSRTDRFSSWRLWVHEGIIRTIVVFLPVRKTLWNKFLLNFIQNVVSSTQVNAFENAWHSITLILHMVLQWQRYISLTAYTELMKNAPYTIWPSQFVNCLYFGVLC